MKPDELMPQAPSHTGTRTQPPLQPQSYAKLAALGPGIYSMRISGPGFRIWGPKSLSPKPPDSKPKPWALGPHGIFGLGGLGSSQLL